MKLTRHFTWEAREDYGYNGFVPCWIKNAEPVTSFGLAHDVLEHCRGPREDGSLSAELMAFGAMFYIRGETGWFSRHTVDKAMGSGWTDIHAYVTDGKAEWYPPTPVPPLENSFADKTLWKIAEYGRECLIREAMHSDWSSRYQSTSQMRSKPHVADCVNFMRMGYRHAKHFYRGIDQDDLHNTFQNLTNAANALEKQMSDASDGLGQRVRFEIHVDCQAVQYRAENFEYPGEFITGTVQ